MIRLNKLRIFVIYQIKRLYLNFILKFTSKNPFDVIYEYNYWGDNESKSGPGSSTISSQSIRQSLPIALKKLQIKKVFDAPCGDMNWIADLALTNEIEYLGGDIVLKLVEENKSKYPTLAHNILHFDILNDDFPKSDAWICRAFLYHLSFSDIIIALDNFYKSQSTYLFVTNSKTDANHVNRDIKSGFWRELNLKLAPFYLPENPILVIEDNKDPVYKSEMLVYHRDQLNPYKTYRR